MRQTNRVLKTWWTWDDVDDLLCSHPQPLVLKQAFSNWAPVHRWDEEYLRNKIGMQQFELAYSTSHMFPDIDSPIREKRIVSVNALLDQMQERVKGRVESTGMFYLDGIPFFNLGAVNSQLESLYPDITLPTEQTPDQLIKSALWVGAAATVSRLHFDGNGCHNLNIQVRGCKEFVLFSPHYIHQVGLLRSPEYRWLSHFSPLDPTPLFEAGLFGVDYWHCTLEPGDGLVIPAMWFHTVRNCGPLNVNVNFWSMPGQIYLSRFLEDICS